MDLPETDGPLFRSPGAEKGAAQTQFCQSINAMSGPRKRPYILTIWQKVNDVASGKRLRTDERECPESKING